MTIVGKILVFVNLLFSLVVGWLAVMSYAARTHWVDGFNKQQAAAQVAQKNAEQYYQEKQKAAADAAEQVARAEGRVKDVQTEVEGYRTAAGNARNEAEKQKDLAAKSDAAAKQAQADAGRRQLEVAALQKDLGAEIERNNTLVKTANEAREKQVASDIRADQLQARATQMEEQLRDAMRQLAEAKSGAAQGGTRTAGGSNPPPENVEGLVKTSDASGLLRLTIGSDAGLAKGHTLEVFRIASTPAQSKYLGRVRVLDVNNHEAVAQPIGRMLDKPQPGDRVASRI
jgi:hypothetical protein